MTQVANVLTAYMNNMPRGNSFTNAFVKGRQMKQAQANADLEKQAMDDASAHEKARQLVGIASTAETPEDWARLQSQGFIPKEMPFESKEPFIMGFLTEEERMARKKQDYQKGKDTRQFGLDERKAKETERHNRASERNAAASAKGGGGGSSGLSASDENAIYRYVAGLFDGNYNPATGQFTGFKDDTSRQQAIDIAAQASQLMKGNPMMTRLEATREAARRNGISIGDNPMPQPGGAMGGTAPAGEVQFQYIPGKGLVPLQ